MTQGKLCHFSALTHLRCHLCNSAVMEHSIASRLADMNFISSFATFIARPESGGSASLCSLHNTTSQLVKEFDTYCRKEL